jgi:hypothetical protein
MAPSRPARPVRHTHRAVIHHRALARACACVPAPAGIRALSRIARKNAPAVVLSVLLLVLGEAISRLEGMAMTAATTTAKFEKNIVTKLEEMMEEMMQAALTAIETKEAITSGVRVAVSPQPKYVLSHRNVADCATRAHLCTCAGWSGSRRGCAGSGSAPPCGS